MFEERDKIEVIFLNGDYVRDKCVNCGRFRVMKCQDGKHYCEKCWWCLEDKTYGPVNGRIERYKDE